MTDNFDPIDQLIAAGDLTGMDAFSDLRRHASDFRQDVEMLILGMLDDCSERISDWFSQAERQLDAEYGPNAGSERYHDDYGLLTGLRDDRLHFCCNLTLQALMDRLVHVASAIALDIAALRDQAPTDDPERRDPCWKALDLINAKGQLDLTRGPHNEVLKAARDGRNLLVHPSWPEITENGIQFSERQDNVRRYFPTCIDHLGNIAFTPDEVRDTASNAIAYIDWLIAEALDGYRQLMLYRQEHQRQRFDR